GRLLHFAVIGHGAFRHRNPRNGADVGQPEPGHMGHVEPSAHPCDVAERVRSHVIELLRIGRSSDAHRVHHDQVNPFKGAHITSPSLCSATFALPSSVSVTSTVINTTVCLQFKAVGDK